MKIRLSFLKSMLVDCLLDVALGFVGAAQIGVDAFAMWPKGWSLPLSMMVVIIAPDNTHPFNLVLLFGINPDQCCSVPNGFGKALHYSAPKCVVSVG
ncbi:MAG TPA: hypothetical protein PLS51_09585 [Flavobacterium sp.]|jgi:hypothetical protein|nr:hypothetical protein [Flavobacterium sp.]HPJ10870.1 hypothetical protein [Flavobacterium sp.]